MCHVVDQHIQVGNVYKADGRRDARIQESKIVSGDVGPSARSGHT